MKKPEIPSYITGQKDKEEISQIWTELVQEDIYDKPSDAVLIKTDFKQPEVSQRKAKISSGPKTEKEKIKPSKQEIISTKKQQVEITTVPKTDVNQLHEKKGLVTTEDVVVSQELKVAPGTKIKARTEEEEFFLISEKEKIPQEHEVEFVLTDEEKSMSQELKVASLSKIDERPGILGEKKFILISEEIVPLEPQGEHSTKLMKMKGIQHKKKGLVLTSEEEPLPQEPATKIETEQKDALREKELYLFSEAETKPHELKVTPVPKIEKRESIPLKKKEIALTLEEEIVPQELNVEVVPKTDTSGSLVKKELVLISEQKALSQELKSAPALKIDEQRGVTHEKEFILISEEESKPQKPQVTPVSKTEEKDRISFKKKEHVVTSKDKLASQKKLKETPAPKVKEKEEFQSEQKIEFAITSEERGSDHHQLIVTHEPKRNDKEQVQLKKKIDLLSKEADEAPHVDLITPTKGEKVSEKKDIITTVPEKLAKTGVVSSETKSHLQRTLTIPGVQSEVVEDVPHAHEKKELIPHVKEDILIPVQDYREVLQKGVIASKGTNGKSRHIILIFTCFVLKFEALNCSMLSYTYSTCS